MASALELASAAVSLASLRAAVDFSSLAWSACTCRTKFYFHQFLSKEITSSNPSKMRYLRAAILHHTKLKKNLTLTYFHAENSMRKSSKVGHL